MLSIMMISMTALVAMADKKMTIHSTDTGESFEVLVPDGLRIYEYNSNWLDSVPYLTEHARRGEPWAYEALAECHRNGRGVKRSLLNALFYYELAGEDIDSYIAGIEQENHDDPIAVFSRIIRYLDNKDYDRVVCAIDTLHGADYHSADILGEYITRKTGKVEMEEVLEYATDLDTDPDTSVFACVGYALCNMNDSVRADISWAKPLIMGKIPYLYSLVGKKKYENTIKSDSPDGYAEDATTQDIEDRRKAAEYFIKADEYAALSKQAARLLYHYCTCDSSSEWVNLSEEDLCRIQQLAGMPE